MSTDNLTGTLSSTGNLNGTFGTSGGGGTSNYNNLINKPQINGNTLEGDKTPAQLGINIPDMTNYYNKSETNTLLDGKANVSDLPDMTNYYDKSETDTLLNDKVNNTSFNAASLPIQSGSSTNTKDYIDTKSGDSLKSYVVEQSGLTVTANSGLNLGDLSTLTGGRITTASQVKCISIINGYGTNYTLMGACAISVTNNIAIYPLRSDTNVTVRIGLIY